MAKPDVKGLLERLQPQAKGVEAGMSRAAALAAQEDARLAAYFRKLEELFPEPPRGWREAAKPPGSAPRTSGRPQQP